MKITDDEVQARWEKLVMDGPQSGATARHRATGKLYSVLGVCLLEADVGPAVLYLPAGGAPGPVWCGRLEEFLEKFEVEEVAGG